MTISSSLDSVNKHSKETKPLHVKGESEISKKKVQYPPLHIIIPVYNESNGITKVIKLLTKVLKDNVEYRITIVDDGSSDDTVSLIKDLKVDLQLNNLNLIQNQRNSGKGYALSQAFQIIQKQELIILMDGDGEHLSSDIPSLIQPILSGKYDLVVGSRFLSTDSMKFDPGTYLQNQKQFSHVRKIGNQILSILISLLYNAKITDSQSGFRAFAPDILSKYKTCPSGFAIETNMLIDSIKQNLRIREIPINTGLSTRESHMSIIKDCLRILKTILLKRII